MKCSFKCGDTPLDKATCQCYNDYMAEAEQRFYSQNSNNAPVSGALPLVEKLESRIKDCDCGLDDVSWGMQEGILISVREAKQLVALLRQ